jgi:hypothetical protein
MSTSISQQTLANCELSLARGGRPYPGNDIIGATRRSGGVRAQLMHSTGPEAPRSTLTVRESVRGALTHNLQHVSYFFISPDPMSLPNLQPPDSDIRTNTWAVSILVN